MIYFSRCYYADVDETWREVKRLIGKGEWNTKAFSEMKEIKEKLLEKLEIKHFDVDPISETALHAILQKSLEESHEKLLEEIRVLK